MLRLRRSTAGARSHGYQPELCMVWCAGGHETSGSACKEQKQRAGDGLTKQAATSRPPRVP